MHVPRPPASPQPVPPARPAAGGPALQPPPPDARKSAGKRAAGVQVRGIGTVQLAPVKELTGLQQLGHSRRVEGSVFR